VKRPTRQIMPEMEVSPIGPFLARMGNPVHITTVQAYLLRDNCLNHFKQQSVDKANRIVRMIEERTAELEKTETQMIQVITSFIQQNAFSYTCRDSRIIIYTWITSVYRL